MSRRMLLFLHSQLTNIPLHPASWIEYPDKQPLIYNRTIRLLSFFQLKRVCPVNHLESIRFSGHSPGLFNKLWEVIVDKQTRV